MLLQKNPVWQALLDDAEARHAIVRNASAAELFLNMTELHLMQANRHPPSPEPQTQPPHLQGPLQQQVLPQVGPRRGTAAGRGQGFPGRVPGRGGRVGQHMGRGQQLGGFSEIK